MTSVEAKNHRTRQNSKSQNLLKKIERRSKKVASTKQTNESVSSMLIEKMRSVPLSKLDEAG